jgi:hypothetical protein
VKYYLFAGCHYYPSGGADDFIKILEPDDRALTLLYRAQNKDMFGLSYDFDWYQIADEEMNIVCDNCNLHSGTDADKHFNNFIKNNVK